VTVKDFDVNRHIFVNIVNVVMNLWL